MGEKTQKGEKKERRNIREISNGVIVSTSYVNMKSGSWREEEVYYKSLKDVPDGK